MPVRFVALVAVLTLGSLSTGRLSTAAADVDFFPAIDPAPYPGVGYDQPRRPQFHFTSKRGWLNDPNGMVYDGERFHLFFQHNPLGTKWGNMTWGHAVSDDLVRWTQQPHALRPYRYDGRPGTIFSGTCVVDAANTLGLDKQPGEPPTLVAFYTLATQPRFFQAMAYSRDRGQTWTYHNDGGPVVGNQGFDPEERDPKVFWHEPSQRWVMVLWVARAREAFVDDAGRERPKVDGRVRIFTSPNLTDWTHASDLVRDWAYECMDVVFLPVDGDPADTRCVLYDASFDYEVGTFDGTHFTPTEPTRTLGRGQFYAAQTFSHMPDSAGLPGDRPGRCVQIGWMRGGLELDDAFGVGFNKQMSFPCDLRLRTESDGIRLTAYPVPEIATLATETISRDAVALSSEPALADIGPLDLADVSLTLEPQGAESIRLDLPGVGIEYVPATGTLRTVTEPRQDLIVNMPPRDGRIDLRLLVDRVSIEAFVFGGEQFGAAYIDPRRGPDTQPRMRATGGSAIARDVTIRRLRSAWRSLRDE